MNASSPAAMDELDRRIVNELQGGFPISPHPFAEAAVWFSIGEEELIVRVRRLVESGALSRFGPLYNAEKMGGAVTLAAMIVPEDAFDRVAAQINAHPEIAHNYRREHRFNMWFVVSAEQPERIANVIQRIEQETGLEVFNMPKTEEFFIGLKLDV